MPFKVTENYKNQHFSHVRLALEKLNVNLALQSALDGSDKVFLIDKSNATWDWIRIVDHAQGSQVGDMVADDKCLTLVAAFKTVSLDYSKEKKTVALFLSDWNAGTFRPYACQLNKPGIRRYLRQDPQPQKLLESTITGNDTSSMQGDLINIDGGEVGVILDGSVSIGNIDRLRGLALFLVGAVVGGLLAYLSIARSS